MTKVAVVKADSYDQQTVEQAMQELLAHLGGMSRFIQPGDRVLVKPNMLEGVDKDKAVTTHPRVVQAVIKVVKEAGGLPFVGDSPALGNARKTAERTGIWDVCKAEGITLSPFQETVDVEFPEGKILRKLALAKEFIAADKVISVAKMKTHSFMGVTGGIKNLFGFIVGAGKAQCHLRMQQKGDFALLLLDLARRVAPALCIVDGITGMEGDGPRNGTPVKAGVLLAGENGFAVDMVMSKIMGFDAQSLPVAVKALAQGLVPPLADIELRGSAADLRLQFKAPKNLAALEDTIPPWMARLARRHLTAIPLIRENCLNCGRCLRHCPPRAISAPAGKARIDYAKCIRCYCCQELCPHDAVHLREGLLLRGLQRWFARDRGRPR